MEMPHDLTEAEKHLIAQVAKGEFANYSSGDAENDKPANAAEWGPERTIRANLIRGLCIELAKNSYNPKGIFVRGARIIGDLELDWLTLPFPLVFLACLFENGISLNGTDIRSLVFNGSYLACGFFADGILVKGNITLRDGFVSKKCVRLNRGNISGALDCQGATFDSPNEIALNLSGLKVAESVFLRYGFIAKGEVRLSGTEIGGQLDCTKGAFENKDGVALCADRAKINGSIFLRWGFSAKGIVSLIGADIGGQFACVDGKFENPDKMAIIADGINVKGAAFLGGKFQASGEVGLRRANILGHLDCSGGTFDHQTGLAFDANSITVMGYVLLSNGFSALGGVSVHEANISGQLDCSSGIFMVIQGDALILESAKVASTLFIRKAIFRGALNLTNAYVGQLVDDETSWPKQNRLLIDGFKYGSIAGESPIDANSRLRWLALQPTEEKWYGFRPQPYEQLVKVLREMGHEKDARIIAIAKQREKRNTLNPLARVWSWVLRISTGYGYETWRAFFGMALMVLIGTGFFCIADGNRDMIAINDGAYVPAFNAFIYSVDAFLPIVDLHQESYWLPHSEFYKWYLWFHISVGWILTTIAVAAFTGLFKDE